MDNDSIEGGNITRTILCQLNDELGSDGAIFKPYTPEQKAEIDATLEKMMNDTYDADGNLQPTLLLDTGWIDNDVIRWCRNKGKESLQCGSKAIDTFRKRSSTSAFRTMALCYYLYLKEGVDEATAQRRCRKLYRWMADYTLEMLMKRWGNRFEELQAKREEGESISERSRPRLIDRLTKEFSREQLRTLMTELKVSSPDRVLISQWKANRWIEQIDKFKYRKLL
jgi:pyruvate-formate lyase